MPRASKVGNFILRDSGRLQPLARRLIQSRGQISSSGTKCAWYLGPPAISSRPRRESSSTSSMYTLTCGRRGSDCLVQGELPALRRLVRQPGNQIDIDVRNSRGAQAGDILEHGGLACADAPPRPPPASTNDCTPRLTRFTPQPRKTSIMASGQRAGGAFHRDLGIAATAKFCEMVTNSRSSCAISRIVGVPPPR